MKKELKKLLKDWEYQTELLAGVFILKYFGKGTDNYWIGDDRSGVLCVNDYFFSLERVIQALRYSATKKQLFDYYGMETNATDKKPIRISFKNFVKI